MRLQEEQVKQAILHPDRDVRDAAVYYFSRSYSQDPAIMPLAIQAIEQHGKESAFESYAFLTGLVQTDETVLWLIGQGRKHAPSDELVSYGRSVRSALVQANAAILDRHQNEILNLESLDDEAKKRVLERISFHSESPEELWRLLEEFCQRSDALDKVPDDLDLANNLIEALGEHSEFSALEVLAILNGTAKYNWLELCAVQLAGELRLPEAIPDIVALLEVDADWMPEEGYRALSKIGGDSVVDAIARAYTSGNPDIRLSVASILENIHSDLSVEATHRLFDIEADQFLRGHLLQAMLMNFSTDAIEPARQFVLQSPLDPDVIEVRNDLLVACKMLDETFPEFDAWTEEAKHDTEFRKKWYREQSFVSDLDELDGDEDGDDDEAYAPEPVVQDAHVGRNDPCPCGSGKKFKKCCLKVGNGRG